MQVSNNLISILKNREALRLKSYQDSGGVWTIGWGATYYANGVRVKGGETITQAQAEILLNYHLGVAAAHVNRLITAKLTQSQFDALVSFTYNVGGEGLEISKLRKAVNADPNNYPPIRAGFYGWVKAGGVFSQGLKNRRDEEIALYESNDLLKKNGSLIWLAVAVLILIIYRYEKYGK